MASPEILILGVGNPLAGDDGFGVEVVRLLRDHIDLENVEVLDGGAVGIYLLPYLEERSFILVIDAMDFGGTPGQTIRLHADQVPACPGMKVSEHQVTFHEVLALTRLMNIKPREFLIIGVQPKQTCWGEALSPELRAVAEDVAAEAVKQTRRWLQDPAYSTGELHIRASE
jgi:hydrogenase maturation protease